jgi:hypothetical protein
MKVTMVIPSYWARESKNGWLKGDAVYDHPTPLDNEGTLHRAIQSIKIMKDNDFRLVVLAVAVKEDIEGQVEEKLDNIIRSASADIGIEVSLFGPSNLKKIHDLLINDGKGEYVDLLKLSGYSNVRNLCLFVPHVLGSEIAVLIDDDQIFEDREFMTKATEFVGKTMGGETIHAVAGYYLQSDGDYHVKKSCGPWMKYWGQCDCMNEAFDKVIGSEPRMKETPFVFGGNMIINRELFTTIPFDPNITRGEDIDFLINARMFGFPFILDNQLVIKHLPPPKTHPEWMQLRQDIYRFIYERAKIDSQREESSMTKVIPEDFDPYPGCFLKGDLEEKIEKASQLLSEEYLAEGDKLGSEESLQNIELSKTDAIPKCNPFNNLRQLQNRWQELMQYIDKGDVRSRIQYIFKDR